MDVALVNAAPRVVSKDGEGASFTSVRFLLPRFSISAVRADGYSIQSAGRVCGISYPPDLPYPPGPPSIWARVPP